MTLISYARRREVGGTIVYPIILAMVIVSATARILKMVSPRFDNMVAHEAHLKVVFLQIGNFTQSQFLRNRLNTDFRVDSDIYILELLRTVKK